MFQKKLWSALLVLCMILAVLTVSAFAAEDAAELVDGYYEIYTADQLYWFAAQVNSGRTSINGKLMADIVVNENVLNADGTLNGDGSNFRVWTPIGNTSKKYTGTFDGNKRIISGLYYNNPLVSKVGLFGYVDSGEVINIGVVDSYLCGEHQVGGVVGFMWDGVLSSCYNSGTIIGGDHIGGVIGDSYEDGSISYCYNTGKVSGCDGVGGVAGQNDYDRGSVYCCYNMGNINGDSRVGGVVGTNYGIVSTCYNAGDINGTSFYIGGVVGVNYSAGREGKIRNCYNIGTIIGNNSFGAIVGSSIDGDAFENCYYLVGCSSYYGLGEIKTNEQFASGEVAYLLGSSFGQNIGGDAYPVLGGAKVYQTPGGYSNTKPCEYVNGFCIDCGNCQPAILNENLYEISNAGQLYWFSEQVSSGNTSINGKLMADIVVNENVLNADGTLNGDGSNFRVWAPIGNGSKKYTGTFEGNGKTVSGLYFNDTATSYVGLFGDVYQGTVQNVGVVASYLSGGDYVGGVVGANGGTISDCYNTGTVSGEYFAGGVVGYNSSSSTVSNSYNTGSVSGTDYVGGVVGRNYGTVTNCYNTGTVSGINNVGGVVGYNYGTVSNSYNTGSVSGGGTDVGGVVGNNDSSSTIVQNCCNTGSVSGIQWVGGVVGSNSGGTVSNCYNTGDVSGSVCVGGVVGYSYGTVSNCYNTGCIIGIGNCVGGVVGENESTVSNCYNTGDVSGSVCVGGVVGYSYGTVSNCYNIGSIDGSGDYVGGVVGYNNDGTINNCYNTGAVSGSGIYVGGVVGYNSTNSTVSNCYNTGSVSGTDYVGGVVGRNYGTVTNCYYLEDCVSIYNGCGTAMTVEQFASGEVAYLLQGDQTEQVWGQLIGAEPYPMLSNEKVYGGNGSYYNSCDHYWDGGSCTEGMNCFICGAVSSYFPGHQWQDATCTTVKTCTVCGLTEGTVREHQYESVVAKPDCSHAGFTTYTCAACGDSYYEDFVAPLGHETYSYSFVDGVHKLTCSLCGVTENMTSTDGKQFKFNTAAPTLSDDIVMNIATTLPAGFGEPYMVVEFNGVTTEINDYTINAGNGRYVFAFPGINPQTMGDTFHATLYATVDGVEVTVTLDYSVMKYINSQLKKTTISAELRTALSDLVMYGQYNQVYEGYKTDALLSSLLDAAATLTPSTFAALGTDFNKMAISGTADSSVDLKGVTLSLGSKLCVWVTVFCADPQNYSVKVTINGKDHIYPVSELPLADGYTDRYVLEFDQIRATQFGEVITVTFLNGEGATVGRTLNYSVYTYIQRNQNTTNENLANLLKAIYNYGESVKKL